MVAQDIGRGPPQSRLEAALGAMSVALLTRAEGEWEALNPAAARLLDAVPMARRCADGCSGPRRPLLEVLDTIELGASEQLELETDGRTRRFVASGLTLPHADAPRLLQLLDVTEAFEEEERRRRTELLAQHALRLESVGQLAAGLSHEINTPMQYLSSNLEFLQDTLQVFVELLHSHRAGIEQLAEAAEKEGSADGSALLDFLDEEEDLADFEFLADELPEALAACWDGVRRVTRTLDDLRSFSEGRPGRRAPVDVNATLRASVDLLRSSFDQSVIFSLELAPELPNVLADGAALRQVIYDLIVNAGQAIERARGSTPANPGEVIVRSRLTPRTVEIEVEDDGPGVPVDIRDQVFEQFVCGPESGAGGGQGLTFVHRTVVEQHGGDVDFRCPEGGGSCFKVSLPLDAA